jgi:3-oxoacyl-[acyl-carrier protein] reductase
LLKSFDDEKKIGPLDILVNCAGITQTQALKRISDDGISDIIDTNLMATIWACKHAQIRSHGESLSLNLNLSDYLHSHDSGCIVNVSSLMATKGGAGATAYAASKGGVLGKSTLLLSRLANSKALGTDEKLLADTSCSSQPSPEPYVVNMASTPSA